jgi:hypothetical protein
VVHRTRKGYRLQKLQGKDFGERHGDISIGVFIIKWTRRDGRKVTWRTFFKLVRENDLADIGVALGDSVTELRDYGFWWTRFLRKIDGIFNLIDTRVMLREPVFQGSSHV